jgi:glycosyltransferase involved in cell wall biosynthesis
MHCNGMSVRGTLAAVLGGVRLVVTHQTYNAAAPHSLYELWTMVKNAGLRRPPHALASAWGMGLADINVCISRFLLNHLRPPRGRVLRNPIGRVFQPRPDIQQTRGFLLVGRLVADKGCDVLLRALAECSARGRHYPVEICGDGPERERLQALARSCGVAEQVRWLGSLHGEELVRAYNRSLGVVVPSVWQEPLGIVALEAMACGRAVIASASGGLEEVVQGVGMLFPIGDSQALADCIIRLAENSGLRQAAERIGAQVARAFRIDVMGKMYLDLYRDVLDQRRKHGEMHKN